MHQARTDIPAVLSEQKGKAVKSLTARALDGISIVLKLTTSGHY